MSKYINTDKVSDYGKENNRIDYGYLAKQEVDNMILCNEMSRRLFDTLEFFSGSLYLEDEEGYTDDIVDIYQWSIIDGSAERLTYYDEIIFYDNELDVYVWAITHWGTGWDYVLTDVKIDDSKE